MAGYGNGLNFQTHQQADPIASLQASLGAGGMFAQTLKSMQAYDENQQKIAMMQSDRDRQAKIDFDAAQEKAKNLGALSATNNPTVTTDYGNYAYNALENAGKDKMIQEAKDTALKGYKPLAYKDIYAGVDTSKMSPEEMSIMQTQLAADSQKSDYTAANKLDVLHKLNMKSGMSSEDAYKAASDRLGLSVSDVAGLNSAVKEELAFGNKVETGANNPLFQQTRGQALKEYRDKYGTTEGIEKAISSTQEAESMAAKEMQQQISQLNDKKATMSDQNAKDTIDRQIDILKLQAESLNSPYAKASLKAEASVGGGSKQSYRSDADKVLASYLNTYKSAPADVRNNITELANQMKLKQYSPEQISAALAGSVSKVDGLGKDPDKYMFSRSSLANQSPDTDAFNARYGAKGSAELNASVYAQADKERNALLNQQAALIAQGGSKNNVAIAELDKRIAELGRSKIESARDAGTLLGQEFMREENLGGYATALEGTEKRTKAKQDNIANTLTGGSSAIPNQFANPVQPGKGPSTPLQQFALPKNYNDLDTTQQHSEIQYQASKLIDSREGTKKDPYAVYKDSLSNPTTGTGILVDGLNKYLGHSYDPKNIQDRDKLVTYSGIMKNNALSSAYKQASELGFSADAIPILASVNYQLGSGWKDEFKQSYALLKKGEYDKAISNIKQSDWHGQTKNRAEDFIVAIEQQKAFKEGGRLGGVEDYYKNLQQSVAPTKTSKPVTMDVPITNATSKLKEAESRPVQSFMTQEESAVYSNPNSRWIDKYSAMSAAEDRKSDYESGINNRLSQLNMTNEKIAKQQAEAGVKAGTADWQVSLLKDYGYGDKYLLMTPDERTALIQQIVNSPGYKLKQGLVH